MGKHRRKSQERLDQRVKDYDSNYAGDSDRKRPGSQNLRKRPAVGAKRSGRR